MFARLCIFPDCLSVDQHIGALCDCYLGYIAQYSPVHAGQDMQMTHRRWFCMDLRQDTRDGEMPGNRERTGDGANSTHTGRAKDG